MAPILAVLGIVAALLGAAEQRALGQQTQTLSYQGSMTASATSAAISAANVTMAPNATFPAQFYWLTVINTGTNAAVICWKGGDAATATGCETLAGGASDRVNLNGVAASAATVPTVYSASGTTLALHD